MTPQRQALETLLKTPVYQAWAATHPVDATKVAKEWAGERRPSAGSAFAASLITLIRSFPADGAPVPIPPPVPTVDTVKFWQSVGFFMSWGLSPGSNWGGNPDAMAKFALSQGAQWVGVQDLAVNRASAQKIKFALRSRGMKIAIWRWEKTIGEALEAIQFWQPDAYISNIEHYDFQAGLPSYVNMTYPDLPKAVISNFTGTGATQAGTYDKAQAAQWIDAGYVFMPECYMVNEQGAQPTLSPQNQEWTAVEQCGWPQNRIFPCFGLYRTKPEFFDLWRNIWPLRKPGLAFYQSEVAQYPYHSFYLLENLAP